MESSCKTRSFCLAVLVVLSLMPTLGRAGEGAAKTKNKKSCVMLLNADKIPVDASAEVRLATARVEVQVDGQTLEKVLTDLGQAIGVPVVILPNAKEHESWNYVSKEFNGTIHDISARSYLDYLFYVLGNEEVSWSIREKKIVVAAMPSEFRLVRRVHKVDKLFDPVGRGDEGVDFGADFLDHFTRVIEPESWNEVGGPGTIRFMELSGAKVLVVRSDRDVQKQVAALITGMERILAEKKPSGSCISLDEEVVKRGRKAMDKKVMVDFNETPLKDVVSTIQKQIGVPILIDINAMESLGVSTDTAVTYQGKDRSLRVLQDEMLHDLELAWMPRFDAIVLTSREQSDQWLHVTMFDVTDILYGVGMDFDFDSLEDLIISTVEPCSWSEVGGNGVIPTFSLHGRAFFAIRQTESITEQIKQLFAGLRAIEAGKVTQFPQRSDEDLQVYKKLAKRADWHVEKGTTLGGFLAELKRKHGIESRVSLSALETLGVRLDSPIGHLRMSDSSIKSVLDILFEPLGLDWIVRHGVLFVASAEELFQESLTTKIYEVSDLTVRADTQGNKYYDFDTLIDSITVFVEPESWMEVGGPGQIREYSYAGRNVIVIQQTEPVLQDVDRLLAELRAAMPKDPAKRVPPVQARPLGVGSPFGGFGDGFGSKTEQEKKQERETMKFLRSLPPHDSGEAALVESNNALAVKLYRQMTKIQDTKKENGGDEQEKDQPGRRSICFSPYSIASLTQAIKLGTRGETEQELHKALCLTQSGDALHRAHGSLLGSLMADLPYATGVFFSGPDAVISPSILGQIPGGGGCDSSPNRGFSRVAPRSFELNIANRLWIQKKNRSQVLPEFEKILKKYYLCGCEEIDFKDPDRSARRINEWVGEKTRQRIKEIVSADDIDPELARFMAVNAVFFQGKWESPFEVSETKTKPFYDSDGKTELGTVPMMASKDEVCSFGKLGGVSILRKPYQGGASFVVLLPSAGKDGLEKLEASLSTENLHKWLDAARSEQLTRLELPKFELKSEFDIIDAMKQLGVKELFEVNADFSGMVSPNSQWSEEILFVDLMRHKATIQVDEVGTVATAVTAMGGMGGMMMPKPKTFIADRPFLFLIVDDKTSSILFMGRYLGPDTNAEKEQEVPDGGFF